MRLIEMDDIYCYNTGFIKDKKSYLQLMENVTELNIRELLTEKRTNLDKYYLELAKNLYRELISSLASYEKDKKNKDYFAKLPGGFFYFRPQIVKGLPDIMLGPRNEEFSGKYNIPRRIIYLAILDEDFTVDDKARELLINKVESLIAHELSHYLNHIKEKGAGVNLDDHKIYSNNKEELDSLIREFESQVMKDLETTFYIVYRNQACFDMKGNDIEEVFNKFFNNILQAYTQNKHSDFYKRFKDLTDKNFHKVYKEIYNYCVEHFLQKQDSFHRDRIINGYFNKYNELPELKKWLADHKF